MTIIKYRTFSLSTKTMLYNKLSIKLYKKQATPTYNSKFSGSIKKKLSVDIIYERGLFVT